MDTKRIREAKKEAQEFIRRCEDVLVERETDPTSGITGTKRSGALRRKSLELTRVLAAMRRYQ